MCEDNQTQVPEFLLLGFQGLYHLKGLLFMLFLIIYTAILCGNLLIIVLLTTIDHLNFPMFYFLKHLALADVLLTTSVMPFALNIIIMEERTVPLAGCLTQLYIFGISGFVQCFLLAVMSYDRYLAIRQPFSYTLIMTPNVCLSLVSGSWFLVFILISSEFVIICQLKFCGLNYLDHFFCDFGPVVALSTSDTSLLMTLDFVISVNMIFVPFVFIVITYILISFMFIGISSKTGRRKFISTCSSHLISVCTYYVSLITVYMIPSGENSVNVNKFRSLLYIVGTPLANPIIYSFRNQEIKAALRKVLKCIILTHRP
ncbi:olfactory receptor 1361-like [Pelobates fuscus]|uniref:olfactory receptor 1361-like n=1 Tax=Pelobates fuscus TaxID=191477 RepID=UPI002FE4557A